MKTTFLTLHMAEVLMNGIILCEKFVAEHGEVLGVKDGPFYNDTEDKAQGTYRMKDWSLKVIEVRVPIGDDGCPMNLSVLVRPPTEDEET